MQVRSIVAEYERRENTSDLMGLSFDVDSNYVDEVHINHSAPDCEGFGLISGKCSLKPESTVATEDKAESQENLHHEPDEQISSPDLQVSPLTTDNRNTADLGVNYQQGINQRDVDVSSSSTPPVSEDTTTTDIHPEEESFGSQEVNTSSSRATPPLTDKSKINSSLSLQIPDTPQGTLSKKVKFNRAHLNPDKQGTVRSTRSERTYKSDSTSTLRSWPQAYHQDYFLPHPGHMQGSKSLAHTVNGQMDGMSTITSASASQGNKLPAPKKKWPWSWIAYYFGAILVFLNPPFGIIGLSGLAIAYIDHRARDYAGSHKKWIIAIAFIITGYVLLILAGGVILIYFIAR